MDSRKFFLSGFLMAMVFASRYSEVSFIGPMLFFVKTPESENKTNLKQYIMFSMAFLLGCLVFVGVFEKMVSSIFAGNLRAFISYTVIEGKCSSAEAIQPRFYYFLHIFNWIPVAILPFLMIAAFCKKMSRIWLFAVIPVLVLSVLSHKELRYLQGVVPFVSILAAIGASAILKTKYRIVGILLVIFYGIAGIQNTLKLLENKTMPAVSAALEISRHNEIHCVALSQAWAYGNGIFIGTSKRIIELSKPFNFSEFLSIRNGIDAVSIYQRDFSRIKENERVILEDEFTVFKKFDGSPSRAVILLTKKDCLFIRPSEIVRLPPLSCVSCISWLNLSL